MASRTIGTGIDICCGVYGPEALVLVALNGCLAGIDSPGSDIDEWWEIIDPDSDV